ncbi:MAG: hypothetical protein B6I25_08585 [Planctomycetales bacterium 4572_13]|nr:MAG: hypothetical protein B6I25_08585 [Planctomycetales bacterium 4572_13]
MERVENYRSVCEDGWVGFVHANLKQVPLACLVDANAVDDRRGPFKKVRSSDMAEVYRYSIASETGEQLLYLKKYLRRSIIDAAKRLFRSSRANRAFEAGLMFEKHGLCTPQIVAFYKTQLPPAEASGLSLAD